MFIERPDATLHAGCFGHGPATLLAIGGWTGSGELWHEVFGHLPGWRCVALDHRGTGASLARGEITVDRMADDLLAVADTVAHGPCVLAAESSGTAVALEAALRAPGRFAGLVTVGASWLPPDPAAQQRMAAGIAHDYPATVAAFVDACTPEPDCAALRQWGRRILARAGADDALALLRSRETVDLQSRVGALRVPALLIHGTLDRIVPVGSSQALAAALPHAELHLLDGLGHVPLMTRPEQVAALITRRFGELVA